MSVICEVAAPFLANAAVEGTPVTAHLRAHFENCLRCQARHSAMARVAREMRAMATLTEKAPLDLEWRVMSSLEGDLAVTRSWRRPLAVAAALASLAAVVIWKMRPRTS